GIAMLSSVLNTEIAIQVNIKIMRTFQKLREVLVSHKELRDKIEKLEERYDGQFEMVFKALRHMLEEPEKPKEKMGFNTK
ncbi:MAG: ORF6N domain-containing protein, partial [Candidatus Paceibacterota bacterium]